MEELEKVLARGGRGARNGGMPASKAALRDRLGSGPRKTELVDLTDAGIDAVVQATTLMFGPRAELLGIIRAQGDGRATIRDMYSHCVLFGARDPATGELLYDPTEANLVAEWPYAAAERVAQAVLRLSDLAGKAAADEGAAPNGSSGAPPSTPPDI